MSTTNNINDERIWKSLDTISERLQDVADKVTDVHLQVKENTTQLKEVLGNGKPGRLGALELKVDGLESFKDKLIGWTAGVIAFSSILSVVLEYAIKHISVISKILEAK